MIILTTLLSACAGRLPLPVFVEEQMDQRKAECSQHLEQVVKVLAGVHRLRNRLKKKEQFSLLFFQEEEAEAKRCSVLKSRERGEDQVAILFYWILASGRSSGKVSPWRVFLNYRCPGSGKCQVDMIHLVAPSERGHGLYDKISYKPGMEPHCLQRTAGFAGSIFNLAWPEFFSPCISIEGHPRVDLGK